MTQQHKTAPAKELEIKTQFLGPKAGVKQPTNSTPRPDLAGMRVKLPDDAAIYLIDPLGYRRWIPNPPTYNNLFINWDGVIIDININEISTESPLTSGAVLAKGQESDPVYLVSNNQKRHIASPAVMSKYYFNWDTIYEVPQILIDLIQTGPSWT